MKVLALIAVALVGYSAAYQQCNNKVDVVLVVEDSSHLPSDSTTVGNLQNFLANIVNYFTLGKNGVTFAQVAYLQYSEATENDVFFLNTFTETNDAKSAILRKSFTHIGDTPSIAHALNHTWDLHLTVNNGERSCFPTVVIVVSFSSPPPPDGLNAKSVDFINEEVLDLNAARQLKNSDALIITVGIGPGRNPTLLLELSTNSSSGDNYFDLSDFDAGTLTEAKAVDIAARACNYAANGVFYPCEMETVSADFTFVVDRSSPNFKSDTYGAWIIQFIQNYLTPYQWGPYQFGNEKNEAGIQAAFLTYTRTADVAVNFGAAKTLDEFITKAQTALINPCTGDCQSRCIYDALDKIQHHVLDTSNKNYRNNCTLHYIFIFTLGCFNCPDNDPVPIANQIRNIDTEIFVVPLQPNAPADNGFGFWKEPLEIANDASHLYEAEDAPEIILKNYLHKQAWRHVCENRGNAFCARFQPTTTTAASETSPTSAPTTISV